VRKYLVEMIGRRVSDGSILRLIGKWINVGVIEEGRLLQTEDGVGQGQVISPFLANVYLNQVLDKWFEDEVRPRLTGKAFLVRYVDDAVICFQDEEDARRVSKVLEKRFSNYGLTLHPEKTRLVEFGRVALDKAERMGRAPDTFDFQPFSIQLRVIAISFRSLQWCRSCTVTRMRSVRRRTDRSGFGWRTRGE
jgi:RNA-directed DNA polymerase